MNKKSIDKTKKSNIKCEHCAFWSKTGYCWSPNSKNFQFSTNYWNRCKAFIWKGSEIDGGTYQA